MLFRRAVHHDAEERAPLVRERLARDVHRGDGLVRRATLDDDEDRCAELVRQVGVEPEREPGGDAGEVRALDEDEVAALCERPVGVEDALAQLVVVVDRRPPRPA